MSHADDTIQRWEETAWIESVCDRWETFFYSLMDEPNRAVALCTLGIMLVTGKCTMPPQSAGGNWYSLFGSLTGRAQEAKELCALGIEIVSLQQPTNVKATRAQIRAILTRRTSMASKSLSAGGLQQSAARHG